MTGVIGIVRWTWRSIAVDPDGVDDGGGDWTAELQAVATNRRGNA